MERFLLEKLYDNILIYLFSNLYFFIQGALVTWRIEFMPDFLKNEGYFGEMIVDTCMKKIHSLSVRQIWELLFEPIFLGSLAYQLLPETKHGALFFDALTCCVKQKKEVSSNSV